MSGARASSGAEPHRAAVARGVDVVDGHRVTGANAQSGGAVVAVQRAEELDELSVDLERDDAVALGIEARRRPRFVADAALETERGRGLEAEEHVPERTDHEQLEPEAAGDG